MLWSVLLLEQLIQSCFQHNSFILIDNLGIYGARSNNKILFTHYWNPPEEEDGSHVIDEQDKSGGIQISEYERLEFHVNIAEFCHLKFLP